MKLSFFLMWFIPFCILFVGFCIVFYGYAVKTHRKFSDQLEYSIWKINRQLEEEKKNVSK